MQKLVTIYLDRESYRTGRKGPSESHGVVQEHLGNFLADGWQIKSVAAGGGGGTAGPGLGCCWVVVLLEK